MSSSQVVDEFLACAREYIAFVDRISTLTRCEFLASCARLLPRIYALGQALPEPDIEQEELPEPPVVQSPMAAIGSLLGEADLYSEVWDPVIDSTALKTYLSDDLADIYCDLAAPWVCMNGALPQIARRHFGIGVSTSWGTVASTLLTACAPSIGCFTIISAPSSSSGGQNEH